MNTVDLNMLERYLTGKRKRTTEEIAQYFGVDKRTVRACVSKLDNEERLVLWSSIPAGGWQAGSRTWTKWRV